MAAGAAWGGKPGDSLVRQIDMTTQRISNATERVWLLAVLLVLAVAGCGTASAPGAAPRSPAGSPSAQPSDPASPATAAPDATDTRPPPSTTRPGNAPGVTSFRTAYDWSVPAEPVLIRHRVRPPVAPPPAPPLPYLAEIRAADHPGERPGYSRISFTFRGGFPSYELGYVEYVRAEGTGDRVPLPGNTFLRIRFIQAQAHDERGRWSVTASPAPTLGYPTLRGYAFGGDFEGYLCYGLGLRVAPERDQGLPVRVSELTRTDGSYVVAVDVWRD